MSDTVQLRIGTRRSPLAMVQAEEARTRLCAAHGWPSDAVELVPVVASGDKIQDRPLADIGGKALWTRELDRWLADGKIDAAVHSLKDVETIRPAELVIAAMLPRADVRDRLIGARSISALKPGAVVGTSAPRRAAQLLHARPDCRIVSIRGNVATRLAKLAAGDVDATFLAAAGLDRLGENGVGHALATEDWLPAPSQGAIGIECLSTNDRALDLVNALDDTPCRLGVEAERALLAALGGTCHSPIAALTVVDDNRVSLTAALFSPDGAHKVMGKTTMIAGDTEPTIRLARDLLDRAVPAIVAVFGGA